jgi:hypothetical protein
VWQNKPLIFWTRLIAVAFVATGRLLFADDQTASSDGYKIVPVTVNGKTTPFRVAEQTDPFKNVTSSESTGKYDPERIFSATSSMANKKFALSSDSVSQSNSDLKDRDLQTFITKPYVYDASSPTAPNLDAKAGFPTTNAFSRSATEFNKSYSTSSADIGRSGPAVFATNTDSADQNRTAALGGPEKTEGIVSNSMANKQYLGPGAQHVPDGIVIKDNIIISRMSGLPNRPLTIDEVRNLINHGTKPDTDVKPEEPSKPLNDPDYKPEPLRDTPQSDTSLPAGDDDKNDPVPPPGTMAAPPENSEPLPQP